MLWIATTEEITQHPKETNMFNMITYNQYNQGYIYYLCS